MAFERLILYVGIFPYLSTYTELTLLILLPACLLITKYLVGSSRWTAIDFKMYIEQNSIVASVCKKEAASE